MCQLSGFEEKTISVKVACSLPEVFIPMLPALFALHNLENRLFEDSLVLTPNNRLASSVQQAWGQLQSQTGKSSWPALRVFAFKHWLQEQWQSLADLGYTPILSGRLISPHQEHCLWEQVLNTWEPLLATSMATQAQQAYRIFQEWQLPQSALEYGRLPLGNWFREFQTATKQQQLITEADLALLLADAYSEGIIPQENQLLLCGFQTLPPLYRMLFEQASKNREEMQPGNLREAGKKRRIALTNREQELQTAALWAKDKLEKAEANSKSIRIGIVIPQLASCRVQVERIFRQQLQPGYQSVLETHSIPPFNISVGQSLADTPLVNTALQLLALNHKQLSLEECQQCLREPFWGLEKQLAIKCESDLLLAELKMPFISTAAFRYQVFVAEQRLPETPMPLSQRLEAFQLLGQQAPKKQYLSQWFELFQKQLEKLGWPGERSLDSIEFQQLQQWQELRSHCLSLDPLLGTIQIDRALRQLKKLAAATVFQPETRDSQLQILGLLESTGLCFDYLWVTDMDSNQWPSPCHPNPLLPVSLQRKHQTPRTCPAKELQIAETQLLGFFQNANEVMFSFCEFRDSQPQQVSPLISTIEQLTAPEHTTQITSYYYANNLNNIEIIEDSYGQPLATENPVRGGAGLFRDQSVCPFNAYARHRLGARRPEPPGYGLDALDRGSIVHTCLEILWNKLGDQAQLVALSEEELALCVGEAISQALLPWQKKRPTLFGKQFLQLQTAFLKQLIYRWLAVEKTRPPFSVVTTESRMETTFAGLQLRLQIDRIDEIQGGHFVIDYKTGNSKPTINNWRGERPAEPQLPLYAVCNIDTVGIAFAAVSPRHTAIAGLQIDDSYPENLLPGAPLPSEKDLLVNSVNLRKQWQQSLTVLAEELKAGYAAVQFQKYSDTRSGQDLWCLNRWPQQQIADEEIS